MSVDIYSMVKVGHRSVLDLSGMDCTEHMPERTGKTDTGYEMILEGFRDAEGTLYTAEDVAQRVIDRLVSDGTIEEDNWKHRYICTHSWSPFDSGGTAHSVYRADLEIYVVKDMGDIYGY